MAHTSRPLRPIATLWEWQLRGSCRDVDPGLFFHLDGDRGASRRLREAAAKAVCAECPVLSECRAHALAVREPYGIWGGLSEDDREMLYGGNGRLRGIGARRRRRMNERAHGGATTPRWAPSEEAATGQSR